MRKFAVTLAATAAFVSMGLSAGTARAAMLSGSQGLRVAAEAGDMIDRVHCRPGRPHHRSRPADGCVYRGDGPVVVRPGYRYYGDDYYDYPGYYRRPGPGVYLGGPGIGIGIGPGY